MRGFKLLIRVGRLTPCERSFLAILVGWFAFQPLVVASPPSEAADSTAYRRIFVPADSPQRWPIEASRYLPMESEKFDQLVDAARRSRRGTPPPPHIRQATHRAEFVVDGLLRGTSRLEVEVSNRQPQLLLLSPLDLTITSVRWDRAPSQPARLGLWSRYGDSPKQAVWVDRPGVLVLEWQLPRHSNGTAGVEFQLRTPAIARQTFELTLSPEYSATITPGERLRVEETARGRKRWTFQLGGRTSHKLRIATATQLSQARPSARVSQINSYHLQPKGLSLVSTLRLERATPLAEDLRFVLSDEIRIVDVTLNQQAANWYPQTVDGARYLVISLPSSRGPHLLKIDAIAPLALDQPWELPTLRPLDVLWTEGSTSLLISRSLELRSLDPHDAELQHIVGISTDAPREEAYRLQQSSRDSSIVVTVGRRRSRLQARVMTITEFGPDESTAKTIATLKSANARTFRWEADLVPGWKIESVTTVPESALRQWHIWQDGTKKVLRADLNQPLCLGRNLRVEIDASSYDRNIVLPAPVGRLKPLNFRAAEVQQDLLLLRDREGKQVDLLRGIDDAVVRINQLESDDAALLPTGADGPLVDLKLVDNDHRIKLSRRPPRFEAHIQVEVTALPDACRHDYRLLGTPTAGAVSEIVVEFDQPPPDSMVWKFEDRPGTVVAEAVTDNPGAYVLRFSSAITEPFQLVGSYEVAVERSQNANMIRVPDASQSYGQVVVRGPLEGVQLVDEGWLPIGTPDEQPSEQPSDRPLLPLLGCYRLAWDKPQDDSADQPLKILRISPDREVADLVAWLAEYATLYAADGTTIHQANYYLENSGAVQAELVLPEGAQLQEAWYNSQQLDIKRISPDERRCTFRLAADQRWQTISVKYLVHGRALGQSTRVRLAEPDCLFPITRGRWTWSTPEQHELAATLAGSSAGEPHWLRRLFGPLVRPRREPIFRPLRWGDWTQLWSSRIEGQRIRETAASIAQALVDPNSRPPGATWGELLTQLVERFGADNIFFVDRLGLRIAGIDSSTAVPSAQMASTVDWRARQLPRLGLALVVSPSSIVLTTGDRVAHWRDSLRPSATAGVYVVVAERLASTLDQPASHAGEDVLPVDAWIDSPATEAGPWNAATLSLTEMSRSAWTVDFVGAPPTLIIYRGLPRRALRHAVWLLTLVVGTWGLWRRPAKLLLAIAVSVALCLVMPVEWLTLPQAMLLGWMSAGILQIILRRLRSLVPARAGLSQSVVSSAAMLFVVAVGSVGLEPSACEAADSANAAEAVTELPRVLVPFDAEGETVGEEVYVDAQFLDRLKSILLETDRISADYAIVGAVYRGSLPESFSTSRSPNDPSKTPPWSFVFDVESFVPGIRIRLPFRKHEATWQDDSHRLDGQPVQLVWDDQGCFVSIDRPGVHRLELSAQPFFSSTGDQVAVDLQIPPVPGARVDLEVAPEIRDIQVVGASVATLDRNTGRQQMSLSSRERLQISWRTNSAINTNLSGAIEQLSWLHVTSAAARLDILLVLPEAVEPPKYFDLEVPSHWKLLPLSPDSPIRQTESFVESPDSVRLWLKQAVRSLPRVRLSFELQRTSTIGQIFYPNVHLKNVVPSRLLFAVSVASELSFDDRTSTAVRNVAVTDFIDEWGTDDPRPLFAYALDDQHPEWSLRVWREPATVAMRQSIGVHCRQHGVRVDYEATIDSTAGEPAVYHLTVPSQFRVKAVTVSSQSGVEQKEVRWSRASDTEVVIFLGQSVGPILVLNLRGQMDYEESNRFELPKIWMRGVDRGELLVDLYRADNIVVRWNDLNAQFQETSRLNNLYRGEDLLVGHYSWFHGRGNPLPRFRVAPNQPRFNADTVLSVDPTTDRASATLRARVEVTKGVLSRIRLEAPANFQLDQIAQSREMTVVSALRNGKPVQKITLSLSPPATQGTVVDVSLAGKSISPSRLLKVPNLRLLGAEVLRSYVMLPTRSQGEKIRWLKLLGLRRQAIPETLHDLTESHDAALPYQIVRQSFVAQQRPPVDPLHHAALRYAIHSATLDAEGHLFVVSELVVQPGHETHCTLRLPPESTLLQLIVGEQRVRQKMAPDRSWRVPLGPPLMPCRIMVVYRANVAWQNARRHLPSPMVLIGESMLSPPPSYWRVQPLGRLRLGPPAVGRPVSAEQFGQSISQLYEQTLEDARLLASELPTAERRAWTRSWREATPQNHEGLFASYPPPLPQKPTANIRDTAHYFEVDSQRELILARDRAGLRHLWRWLTAATLVGVGLLFLPPWKPASIRYEWLYQWPHSLAFAVGIFWWLLFQPSAVGLLLIALTTVSLCRQPWWLLRRAIAARVRFR